MENSTKIVANITKWKILNIICFLGVITMIIKSFIIPTIENTIFTGVFFITYIMTMGIADILKHIDNKEK